MIKKFSKIDLLPHFFMVGLIAISSFIVLFFELTAEAKQQINKQMEENLIYLKLKDNAIVVIELRPDLAPKHVARIKELTRQGFYNGIVFHRVIEGFMAQTGDPTGTGRGGSGKNIPAEFSKATHARGVVSMARAEPIDSADSQFFIVLQDSPFLDGKYTVWGKVKSGMEHVDNIKKARAGSNGIVENPDSIVSMALVLDVSNSADKSK